MDLKKKIKDKGFTLSYIASKMRKKDENGDYVIGISQPTLSDMIKNPTLARMEEIASIMGISLAELISDDVQVTCPHCGNKLSISLKLDVTN